MNKEHPLRLDTTGIFLFSSPVKATVTVQKEVIVVLYIPAKKSCGIAYLPHVAHTTEWNGMLDRLLHKIEKDLNIQQPKIIAKIFGAAIAAKMALQTTKHWLGAHRIEIRAQETGGEHTRKLLIECETGRVGVAYHTENPSELFLTTGTARQRNPLDTVETEILVISKSVVKRTLAKQSIEEHPNWTAATPKNPLEFLKNKKIKDFPWSVVLIFDDIEEINIIEEWIQVTHSQFPSVQFRWVGVDQPVFSRRLPFIRHLPPLEPILLPEFKSRLHRAFYDYLSADKDEPLYFTKKRAK